MNPAHVEDVRTDQLNRRPTQTKPSLLLYRGWWYAWDRFLCLRAKTPHRAVARLRSNR